ncbi:hypothetical protein HDV00_007075 [Rhizophlyctis rosea]|nr:hypothetical protein HDV00_007075 [Rhizophlyctis rosea]
MQFLDSGFRDNVLRDALYIAAKNGHTDVVRTLLGGGAMDGVSVSFSKEEIGMGYSAYGRYALNWAADKGHADVVVLLLDSGTYDPMGPLAYSLELASEQDHAEVVKVLLNAGAYIRKYTFRRAVSCEHVEVVKLLADAGADIHDENDRALYRAVQKGNFDLVRVLLGAGSNVYTVRKGECMLELARRTLGGREELERIVEVLVAAGAREQSDE